MMTVLPTESTAAGASPVRSPGPDALADAVSDQLDQGAGEGCAADEGRPLSAAWHAVLTLPLALTPILIVSYRNVNDVVGCLTALSGSRRTPAFEIFICENGGSEAYDALVRALTAAGGPCLETIDPETLETPELARRCVLRLVGETQAIVRLGEARENLGYAGGVNAWLRPLMERSDWLAVWVLNPDTTPAPDALLELAKYAWQWDKGMIGSRLVPTAEPDIVHSRGLRWNKFRALSYSVDLRSSADVEPDPREVDARIDAPSGASMYVTRSCIEHIGLMDPRYFLYYEDLEWGLRAKSRFGVGYAHRSIVVHTGGTTIGTSIRTTNQSALAVYLEFRNIVLFVRDRYPSWLLWTIAVQAARILLKARSYPPGNLKAAISGVVAGILGRDGRPTKVMRRHEDTKGGGVEA